MRERYRQRAAFSSDAYMRRHFPDAKMIGDERAIPCLLCGKPKMSVNVKKGIWACFHCEAKGTMFSFVKLHLKVDDRGAFEVLGGFAEPTPPYDPGEFAKALKPAAVELARQEPRLPDGYRALPVDSVIGRRAWDYLAGRGVTADQIATHRIGVATRGRYAGCVILPVIQGGDPVYFVARKFLRSGNKYLNPANGETALTASEVLFNVDVAALFGRVHLVEGYFDALGEGSVGVAMLGKVLHPTQLAVLSRAVRRDVPVRVKHDDDVALAYSMETARMVADAGYRDVAVERTIGDPAQRLGTRGSEPYTFENLIASKVGGKR